MTRQAQKLKQIEVAGYHGDKRAALRIFVGSRIAYASYQQAFARGARAKQQGVKCTCAACKEQQA